MPETESFGPVYNDDGTCSEATRAFARENGREAVCDKHDEWIKKAKVWAGSPTKCDVCSNDLEGPFVDGATRLGPWAIMCPACFAEYGIGLGSGRGQRYHRYGKVWVKETAPKLDEQAQLSAMDAELGEHDSNGTA